MIAHSQDSSNPDNPDYPEYTLHVLERRFSRMPCIAVDSGIVPLLQTSTVVVALFRIASVAYREHDRIFSTMVETMVKATLGENNTWSLMCLPLRPSAHADSSSDERIESLFFAQMPASLRATAIEEVLTGIRVFGEEQMMLACARPEFAGGIMLCDGFLPALPRARVVAQQCLSNNILLLGVAKQTSFRHGTVARGEHILALAKQRQLRTCYARDPSMMRENREILAAPFINDMTDVDDVARSTNPMSSLNFAHSMYWCKLHAHSDYVFCVTLLENRQEIDVSKVLGILADYATDSVFSGYPYPLVFADQLARVSNREAQQHVLSYIYTQEDGRQLYEQSLRLDPHKVLDNLQY